MRPTVYIETTIPSYYFDQRPELAQDIQRTREWWDRERVDYECFISLAVIDELASGNYPYREQCLELVRDLPILRADAEIEQIADVYRTQKLMPIRATADAAHVAFASFYRLDYLLTWNCRHLANVNKARQLRAQNEKLGLHVPQIVTPDQTRPWEHL